MLYADYNFQVNDAVYSIVGGIPDADRRRNAGSFHISLFQILSHVYSSDVGWLLRIESSLGPFRALAGSTLADPLPARGETIFPDFETLQRKRPDLDNAIVRLAAEISLEDLHRQFVYKNRHGQEKRVSLWQAFLHMFNHETHHRGVISQILDEMKIENDFSNVMDML